VDVIEVGQQFHRVGVVDDRCVAGAAQRDRHDVQFHRRQVVEAEFAAHHSRRRDLHRTGDLEPVALEKLDGGSHSARIQLRVEAHGAQPGALQQQRRSQSVVARTDHDRVIVRHPLRLTRRVKFCQY
jgi:hypothetical protein